MTAHFSCLLVLFAVGSSPDSAENWPRFLGPNASASASGSNIPVKWTQEDYRWRVELPGIGYSSPVVWGDRVLVTSADEETGALTIHCFSTTDGQTLWRQQFAGNTYRKHAFNSYASSTPALDAEHAYLAWATPEEYVVVAIEQTSGEEVWRASLGPFLSQHGFGTSPVLFEDLVILANEQDGPSSIVALDRKTGKTRWQAERRTEKAAFSTPFVYQPEEGPPQLILTSWAHGFSSLDPRTGKANWELPIFKYRVVGSPCLAAGLFVATCGEGGVGKQALAIRPGNPATGQKPELAYEISGSLPYVPTPLSHGNLLFLWYDRGIVTCLDAPSGKLVWRERIGGDYFGSPVRVDNRLYCISRQGEVVVLAAADRFELLGRVDLGEPSHSTPAVAGGVMYLRTVSHLMALGSK